MRDLGHRILAGQQGRRGVAQLALERLRFGPLVADHRRLAGALEEDMGDLDGRGAGPQGGEPVDAPLRELLGLDEWMRGEPRPELTPEQRAKIEEFYARATRANAEK